MPIREKCKCVSITVLHHTFHIQICIYSAAMWLQYDFDHFIVLYLYFGKKKIFQKYITHYNKVKSHFITTFQGTHLNQVFKTIQGVYSLKIALLQNLGWYLWKQVMPPLKTSNLGKPIIQLNPFTFSLFIE